VGSTSRHGAPSGTLRPRGPQSPLVARGRAHEVGLTSPRHAPQPPKAPSPNTQRRPRPGVSYSLSPLSPTDLDTRLLLLARTFGHTPARERAVAAFSRTGEHAACWLALGLAGAAASAADPRRRQAWIRDTATVAASYALNTGIKFVVRRPRPELPGFEPLTSVVTGLSFPSAHATTSFAAARGYGARIPPAPLYTTAVLFALSRVYLGVHYPSDVLAGALLGTALAAVAAARGAG
jgi:hypothetical protein